MGAYGAISAGSAANRSAKYQAKVYEQQRKIAEQTAATNLMLTDRDMEQNLKAITIDASFQSDDVNSKALQVEGGQKTAMAASGVGGGSVTQADVVLNTEDMKKKDEMMIRYNADANSVAIRDDAARRKWQINEDLKFGNWSSGVQSSQVLQAGRNAQYAGYINAASSVMSSASSTYGGIALRKGL